MPSVVLRSQTAAAVTHSYKEPHQLHRYITTRKLTMFHAISFALAVIFAAAASPVRAQTLLDPTFNISGKRVAQYISFWSKGNDAVLQDDGKLIVVGSANTNPDFGSFQLTIMRFNGDGSLDTTFSGDGKVASTTDPAYGSKATGVALQPDGKLVVVGTMGDVALGGFGGEGIALVHRYHANGTLDTAFDGDGMKVLNFGISNSGAAGDVVILPDGKMIIAVLRGPDLIITRLNADGSTDAAYGTGGKTVINVVNSVTGSWPKLVLEPDGKVLVSAPSFDNPLVELNVDGTLNTGFGAGGRINGAGGNEVVRQPDGKVLTVDTYSQVNTVVRRYNADGMIDISFGVAGAATVLFAGQEQLVGEPTDLVLQPDGKIVLGTSVRTVPSTGTLMEFGLARLNAYGEPDLFFGFNGRLLTDIQGDDRVHAAVLQPDGKIFLVGESGGGFTVTRYSPGSLNNICRPVADFDVDGKSDLAYFNPTGDWQWVRSSDGVVGTVNWGLAGDRLVPADYDGDCRTELGIYRNGIWHLRSLNGVAFYFNFGLAGDIAVPGDYDGDDRADPTVYRNGMWYTMGIRSGFRAVNFGLATDKPVPGDYDGDGTEDIAVYRDGVWYLLQSRLGFAVINFGLASDKPVVGDYDGDGMSDIAVFRPSDGIWYIQRSTLGFQAVNWGVSTDTPVPADFDGDAKTDIAVYRDGDWYLLQGTAGFQLKQFGNAEMRPIQNAYVP